MIKYYIVFTALSLLFLFTAGMGQQPQLNWQVGEELTYKVKWSFITLGELRLQVIESDTLNQRPVYFCRIYIDSNPALLFVKLHDIYESYIDAENFYPYLFNSFESKGGYTLVTQYRFDHAQNLVHVLMDERYKEKNEVILDTVLNAGEKIFDSLSLLFYARAMTGQQIQMQIPVMVVNKIEYTSINFQAEPNEIEYQKQKRESYYVDGKLKFVGIAGVKDDFRGWFSPDGQRIPLKAAMKAFIGSVSLELTEWKNWRTNPM